MKITASKVLTVLIVCIAIICVSIFILTLSVNKNPIESNKSKNKTTKVDNTEESERVFDDLGVKFKYPDKWILKEKSIDAYATESKENIYGQLVVSFIPDETMEKAKQLNKESEKISETDTVKIKEISDKIMALTNEFKDLFRVVVVDKNKKEGALQKELFSKYKNKDLLGKEDQLEFYLLYNDTPNTDGLTPESQKDYEQIYSEIKDVKKFIQINKPISEVEKLNQNNKFTFNTKTLNNKKVDSSILKDSKLTMVNIWATYCGPCIGEMPELQKLYEEVKKDDVNIIGLVSDTPDKDNENLAKQIVSKKGVKYDNLIPDKNITDNLLKDVSGVPTTFFVDSEGNIVGDFIVGVVSKTEYKNEIEKRLQSLN